MKYAIGEMIYVKKKCDSVFTEGGKGVTAEVVEHCDVGEDYEHYGFKYSNGSKQYAIEKNLRRARPTDKALGEK